MDENEAYRLYDNTERAFVNQKEYASEKTANQVAERKNQQFGEHRFSAEKYSDIVQRNTPKSSVSIGLGGGSGAGVDVEGLPAKLRPRGGKQMKAGGKVGSASKRADGIAQRGKTRGRMV